MRQEDKELLLKDLCTRLPYGVCIEIDTNSVESGRHKVFLTKENLCSVLDNVETLHIRLYLRPMSSMTEEEKIEYGDRCYFTLDCISTNQQYYFNELYDWLNAHHFDYNGLIEKGLAMEVTDENNPY